MIGGRSDIPMMAPPVATGSIERDDESIGRASNNGGIRGPMPLSDRS